MKTKRYIGRGGWTTFLCLLTSVSLMSACDREESPEYSGEARASLSITLRGEGGSRAVAPTESADLEALATAENTLKNVTVFVFNSNGTLDRRHEFAPGVLTETIEDLIAGPKKVVVLANIPSTASFPEEINYDWFDGEESVIDLDSQSDASAGLFMSGEMSVTLAANATAETTIPLSRLVAKVKLGTVTIAPDAGHDPAKFELKNVYVMKARGSVRMGVPSVAYTPDVLYGGMAGDKSTVKPYLAEPVTKGNTANRYFYVLPSDNEDGNATLLTLEGTYGGQTVYFPFRINDKPGTTGSTNDGNFIRRNHVYVVNVTLKRLGSGSDNPETPSDPASLEITVDPQPWETELIQNVEW